MVSINMPGATITGAAQAARQLTGAREGTSSTAPVDATGLTKSQRLELVGLHGDFSLAYATAVQSMLRYFGDERGYLAYGERWGYTFVLGDPVAAPQRRAGLIREFLARHRQADFCQISAETARVVQQQGHAVNEMGVDTVVELPSYDFQGQEKEWLRYAANWTSRRGYDIREETVEQVGADRIRAVSEAWRGTRTIKRREVVFLNRPLRIATEQNVRRFNFYDADERLLAFVYFDPLYRAGQRIGYVACIKRRHPDAPIYAEQAIMKRAIEVFRGEGCQELRLGLSPLAWIEDREFRASWLLGTAFRFGFSSRLLNRLYYNVQGHATYKRRFRGREEKLYFATRGVVQPLRLMALVKLCNIV